MAIPRILHTVEEKKLLLSHLERQSGWCTARSIWRSTGLHPRLIRSIAGECHLVLGGGTGYKLCSKATHEELSRVEVTLRSRARKIMRRASSVSRIMAAAA